MTNIFTLQDVLDDIEVELIQGAVARNELGQAIQDARKYQNKLRGELLAAGAKADYTTLATRQFQLNDMLLTLVQELAASQQALRAELMRALTGDAFQGSQSDATAPLTPTSGRQYSDAAPAAESAGWENAIPEIEAAMQPDALDLAIAIHDEGHGALARLTRPVRSSFHSLAVYYVNQLAAREAAVNRLYGDRLLALHEQLGRQQTLIAELQAQLSQG